MKTGQPSSSRTGSSSLNSSQEYHPGPQAAPEVVRSVVADKVARAVDDQAAMAGQEQVVAGPVAVVREVAWAPEAVVVAGPVVADQVPVVDPALEAVVADQVPVDQALEAAVADPVAVREEEVAGEPARFPSSSPIEQ
jgi:hypothetical protein